MALARYPAAMSELTNLPRQMDAESARDLLFRFQCHGKGSRASCGASSVVERLNVIEDGKLGLMRDAGSSRSRPVSLLNVLQKIPSAHCHSSCPLGSCYVNAVRVKQLDVFEVHILAAAVGVNAAIRGRAATADSVAQGGEHHSVCTDGATAQPTMRRLHRSSMAARYSQPSPV